MTVKKAADKSRETRYNWAYAIQSRNHLVFLLRQRVEVLPMSGESLERYFRLAHGTRGRRPSGRLWNPAADVYRIRDGWIVKVDLAGVKPDDIQVSVEGPVLHISGLRRDSTCGEGISHYQLEITYSRFEKTIQFPSSIESASVARDYRDGLLILRLREEREPAERARSAGRS